MLLAAENVGCQKDLAFLQIFSTFAFQTHRIGWNPLANLTEFDNETTSIATTLRSATFELTALVKL